MLTLRRIRAAVAILVVAVLVLSCGQTGGQTQRTTRGLCAIMADSIGLYQGNSVTRMGVPVGTVDRIEPTSAAVRVTFSLNGGIAIPAQTKAVTRNPTILADRSLELSGGIAGEGVLTPGNCIPLERTATAKSISESISSTSTLVTQITNAGQGDTLNRLLGALDQQLAGNGPAVRDTFGNLAAVAGAPARDTIAGTQLLRDLSAVMKTNSDNWAYIESTLRPLPGVLQQLSSGVLWSAATIFGPTLDRIVRVLLDMATHYHDILWNTLDAATATFRLLAEHTGVIVMYAGTLPNILDGVRSFWARLRARNIPVLSPRVAAGVADDGKVCSQTDLDPGGKVRCGFFYGVPEGISSVDVLQLVLNGGVKQPWPA